MTFPQNTIISTCGKERMPLMMWLIFPYRKVTHWCESLLPCAMRRQFGTLFPTLWTSFYVVNLDGK